MGGRPLFDRRYAVAASSLLILAVGCEAGKAPQAHPTGAIQQASRVSSVAATADPEADYLSAKRGYLAALTADQHRGTPDSVLMGPEQADLRDLADRLRSILGPFQAKGFAGPGTLNVTSLLPPDVDFNSIDGIVYQSPDSVTVLVTTTALLAAWLRDPVMGDTTLPHDPLSALAHPELYAEAFPADAAVARYADIPVDSAAQSGIVAAMLVMRTQDVGPGTPGEVMVSVVRGKRIYFAEAHARALIAPPPSCLSIWETATRGADSIVSASRSTPSYSTAVDSSEHIQEAADAAVRRCYGEHAPADPRFAALVQQVDGIVRRLPTQ